MDRVTAARELVEAARELVGSSRMAKADIGATHAALDNAWRDIDQIKDVDRQNTKQGRLLRRFEEIQRMIANLADDAENAVEHYLSTRN